MAAILQSGHSGVNAIVTGHKKVRLGANEMSLTAATRQVMGLEYGVASSPHWTYEGRSIHDTYEGHMARRNIGGRAIALLSTYHFTIETHITIPCS